MKEIRKISNELAKLRKEANEIREKQEDKILSLLYKCYHKNTDEEFEILMFRHKSFILGYKCNDTNIHICVFAYKNFIGLPNNPDEFVANLCGCENIKKGSEDYIRINIIHELLKNNFLEKGLILMRTYRKELKPFINNIYNLENQLKSWEQGIDTRR